MRKAIGLGWALGMMGGCEQEFSILDSARVSGVPNPPALETPVKTDRITQVDTPMVDVLWVIDDSGSMSDEQRKLTRNIRAFMDFFLDSGLDWHMGVVTVDVEQASRSGKLVSAAGVKYVDTETPDPVESFNQLAMVGTGGLGDESGLRAAYLALTDPLKSGYNAGFYRDNATLHVVVISDEDDQSGDDPSVNEFIDFLTALKPDPDMVTFSSIVGPPGLFNCFLAEPGQRYMSVTDAVGGIHSSICEADWVPVLEQLGLQAAGLKSEFFLSELPVPGTIEVVVVDDSGSMEGVDLDALGPNQTLEGVCEADACFGFTYDSFRNSVVFDRFFPSQLSQVNITYELLAYQEEVP